MAEYKIKPGKIGKKAINTYKNIEERFKETFLEEDETKEGGYRLKTGKTEKAVVRAYKKIEDGVTGAYKKVENAFVDAFLEKTDDEEKK